MTKLKLHTEKCKGCYLCAENCPKQAITASTSVNAKGYNYIEVDEEKCVSCGSCYQMCPDYVIEILE